MVNAFTSSKTNAAFYVIQHPGYVRFAGDTRREYLQRQTTNNLDYLAANRALPSLLTSPTGRILERFTLIDEGDAIGMITQPGHGPGLAEYFGKRIFFTDQVTVKDASSQFAQIELHGLQASEVLMKLGFASAPAPNEIVTAQWSGIDVLAFGEEGFVGELRFLLIFSASQRDQLTNRLIDLSVPQLDFATRELLRIEAGMAGDPEFQNEYTPFEVGLDGLVSTDKGCYTGQEVLARQVTYDKVVRHMVRLKAADAFERGASIFVDGKEVGKVSSAANSPEGGHLGLAVIRKPRGQTGSQLEIGPPGSALTAQII